MADQIRTRPAVRELVQLLTFRSSFGRPCYVKLGDQLVDVPAFDAPALHWAAEPAHQGRTISLTEVAR